MSPHECLHPVLRATAEIGAVLKDVADVDPTFMTTADKAVALEALSTQLAQLEGLRLRVMASAQDVADRDAVRTVAGWLESRTRTEHGPALRSLKLAQALDRRWHRTATALAHGQLNLAQAEVISRALDELPPEVPRDTVVDAESHLVEQAARFGPKALARLGRRVLEVVAPDLADEQERLALEREEARAGRLTSLFSQRLGDGTTRITLRVADVVALRLQTYLEAFTAPRRVRGDATGLADRMPSYQAKGLAFGALLEALDPRRVPLHGGDATTLMVTVSLDQLRSGLGAAALGPDERLSVGQARRLGCTAKIIPVVLGGRSEILDLGRAARLFSPPQRRAMAVRDQRCRGEGCSVPAAWCEAHHFRRPWSQGGRTDLADGKLLCAFHHHRAHDERYSVEELVDGDLRFRLRT